MIVATSQVLMHPRCMNCHPSGESPLQGDDSHVHMQNVKRGADGQGKYALKCANCHQDTNLPGANMPPGNPTWHLPRKDMPLVFQGKSPRELADKLKDAGVFAKVVAAEGTNHGTINSNLGKSGDKPTLEMWEFLGTALKK